MTTVSRHFENDMDEELLKQFWDNPSFRKWLLEIDFGLTYGK
jgi:hypothetical protein